MNPMTELLDLVDRYTAQRNPYGRQPVDVLIVTAVGAGYVYCRRPYDTISNNYPYVYNSSAYPSPAVGDRVCCDNLPGGPVISGKLAS